MSALVMEEVYKNYPLPRKLGRILLHPRERRWKEALRGVSFTVEPGEVFTVMGPTGAGKTTLFKMILALLMPDRGRVEVWGRPVVGMGNEVKRRVGLVVSDERSFYWRLTGRENLLFFAAMHNLFGAAGAREVQRVLEQVGLTDVQDERFTGYSAGMRQKLAIARGLLHDPEMLVLDEPTRSLDPAAQLKLARFITGRLAGELERTVLVATHDLSLVERIGRRVLLLHDGRVRALGDRGELARLLRVTPALHLDFPGEPPSRDRLDALPGVEATAVLEGGARRLSLEPDTRAGELLHALMEGGMRPRSFRFEEAGWSRIVEQAFAGEEAP